MQHVSTATRMKSVDSKEQYMFALNHVFIEHNRIFEVVALPTAF